MPVTDDLAGFFAPAAQGMGMSPKLVQGVVLSWSTVDGSNSVGVGPSTLNNLPCISTGAPTVYQPGDAVLLLVIGSTFMILGRVNMTGGAGLTREADLAIPMFPANPSGLTWVPNANNVPNNCWIGYFVAQNSGVKLQYQVQGLSPSGALTVQGWMQVIDPNGTYSHATSSVFATSGGAGLSASGSSAILGISLPDSVIGKTLFVTTRGQITSGAAANAFVAVSPWQAFNCSAVESGSLPT
jgi:hypothetical protein